MMMELLATVAGIAPDLEQPGFRRILLAPKPDRRLGFKFRARTRSSSIRLDRID